jgi:hypothetical protein
MIERQKAYTSQSQCIDFHATKKYGTHFSLPLVLHRRYFQHLKLRSDYVIRKTLLRRERSSFHLTSQLVGFTSTESSQN